MCVCVCVCVRVCACVRACACVCVRVCVPTAYFTVERRHGTKLNETQILIASLVITTTTIMLVLWTYVHVCTSMESTVTCTNGGLKGLQKRYLLGNRRRKQHTEVLRSYIWSGVQLQCT